MARASFSPPPPRPRSQIFITIDDSRDARDAALANARAAFLAGNNDVDMAAVAEMAGVADLSERALGARARGTWSARRPRARHLLDARARRARPPARPPRA